LRKETQVNGILQDYGRKWLLDNIRKCNQEQQKLFKRMYCPEAPDTDIETVVKDMMVAHLDWAMVQVQNTVKLSTSKETTDGIQDVHPHTG
jgi:hypothetical protein